MPRNVIIRDRGYKRFAKRLVKIGRGRGQVTVGVHSDVGSQKHKDADITNAMIGAMNDLGFEMEGTDKNGNKFRVSIPERKWLRGPMDANRREYLKLLKRVYKLIYVGKIEEVRALGLVAEVVKRDVRKGITAGLKPELSDKTIRAREIKFGKKSTKPLIATGEFLQAIDAKSKKRLF